MRADPRTLGSAAIPAPTVQPGRGTVSLLTRSTRRVASMQWIWTEPRWCAEGWGHKPPNTPDRYDPNSASRRSEALTVALHRADGASIRARPKGSPVSERSGSSRSRRRPNETPLTRSLPTRCPPRARYRRRRPLDQLWLRRTPANQPPARRTWSMLRQSSQQLIQPIGGQAGISG